MENQSDSEGMNIARASISRFLADGTGVIVKIVGLFYFARILGPESIGIFFLFEAVSGATSKFVDLDISEATSKRISEGDKIDSTFTTALLLKIPPLAVVAAVVLVFASEINAYLGTDLALLLVVHIALSNLWKLVLRVLQGELRVGETALPRATRDIVAVGTGAVFLLADFGVRGLVYGLLLGDLATLLIAGHRASVGLGRPSRERAVSLYRFFKYSFVSSLSGYVFKWTDTLLIGLFLTQADVGVYEIPWRVTVVFLLLSNTLGMAIFPQISEWEASEVSDRIENLVSGAISVSLFLVVPAFVGALLLGREVLQYGFGPEYATGWLVFVVVAAVRLVAAVDVVFRNALQAIGRQRLSAYSEVGSVLFNAVLNVVLIWYVGILGAAVASLCAIVLRTGLNGIFLDRFIALRLPVERLAAMVAASGGMGVVLWMLLSTTAIETLWELLAVIGGGAVIYGVFGLLLAPLRIMIVENIHRITGTGQ